MTSRLSFAQRLKQQGPRQKQTSLEKVDLSQKIQTPVKSVRTAQQIGYVQFQKRHNELKNMLKLLEVQNGQQFNHPLQPTHTPARNPLYQKTENQIQKSIHVSISSSQAKENLRSPVWFKNIRQDYKPVNSLILTQIQEKIPLKKQLGKGEGNTRTKKGIPNIGNTCYINALVQCLFYLPHFNDYFSQQRYKSQRNGKNKDVVEMYKTLFINVIRNNSQVDLSTLPLKRSVSNICSLFMDWQQEDAHEFMKKLLNSIHDQLNRVTDKPKYKQLFKEVEGESAEKKASAYWNYEKQRDDSYIYDSLCGQTYNNIKCITCSHQSQCFENFLDLSIPIRHNAHSLNQLLEDFFQPEKLSDFYLCGKCNKSSKKSIKTVQLWRAPKFLIIQLKRSQFGKKNTDTISVPQSLSLKPFMNISTDKTARFCQYSLCGMIMHEGVLEGGHYWCNVKQNGKWFSIDDEHVKQLDSQQLRKQITQRGSSNAYILFYSSLYC